MIRILFEFVLRVALGLLVVGALAIGGGVLVGQYMAQRPAGVLLADNSRDVVAGLRLSHPEWQPYIDRAGAWIEAHGHWRFTPLAAAAEVNPVPDFGDIGARAGTFDRPVYYDADGHPLPSPMPGQPVPKTGAVGPGKALVTVQNADQLMQAVDRALPGQQILILPGVYTLHNGRSAISVARPGRAGAPIFLRAAALGSVTLRFQMTEGFLVQAPWWVFENLVIEGVCANDEDCEHAFHIVGDARNIVVRNNVVRNFNAQIKINPLMDRGLIPDDGLIENNTFYDDAPRRTDTPTTVIDLVAASRWVVRRNVIADFGKSDDRQYAYGAFFKGAGQGGAIEQNLVLCAWRHGGGQRVGLSLGGGGTGANFCADRSCAVEYRGGAIRNNIIANCEDSGIYLNRAADSVVANNLLWRTRGIDARFADTNADIDNNLFDGRIWVRDGATVRQAGNVSPEWRAALLDSAVETRLAAPDHGDFRWKGGPPPGVARAHAGNDFCGIPHDVEHTVTGPFARNDCAAKIRIPGLKSAR